MLEQNRLLYLRYADTLRHPNDFSKAISEFFAPEANINIVEIQINLMIIYQDVT